MSADEIMCSSSLLPILVRDWPVVSWVKVVSGFKNWYYATQPVLRDCWNTALNIGHNSGFTILSSFGHFSSGPGAEFAETRSMAVAIPSGVISIS